MTGRGCGICGSDESTDITITDDDGGVAAYACGLCLGRLVAGDECAVCGEAASGRYQVILPPARWSHPRYRVCSACRRRWVFDNTEPVLPRLDRLDSDEQGRFRDKRGARARIPLPTDTCEACERRRDELPTDARLTVEIGGGTSPEWLCDRCRERGRGLS